MYKWPAELDPSIFVGQEVDVVAVKRHSVALQFDSVLISMECPMRLRMLDDSFDLEDSNDAAHLIKLLGKTVVESSVGADGSSLRLVFEGGNSLTIIADDSLYECYDIMYEGRRYIV